MSGKKTRRVQTKSDECAQGGSNTNQEALNMVVHAQIECIKLLW